ncbi:hypothetical protein J6590_020714 [Homalodisca vitripennis]|nr:hypothetical protein J6590_020714 [Homalodisca vitripennis]
MAPERQDRPLYRRAERHYNTPRTTICLLGTQKTEGVSGDFTGTRGEVKSDLQRLRERFQRTFGQLTVSRAPLARGEPSMAVAGRGCGAQLCKSTRPRPGDKAFIVTSTTIQWPMPWSRDGQSTFVVWPYHGPSGLRGY